MRFFLTQERLDRPILPKELPPSLTSSRWFALLESSLTSKRPTGQARYSIVAADPLRVIDPGTSGVDPFSALRESLVKLPPTDLPFAGGWIGYLGYELYSSLEPHLPRRTSDLAPPAVFGFYDTFYLYDHWTSTGTIASLGLSGGLADGMGQSDVTIAHEKIGRLKHSLGVAGEPRREDATRIPESELGSAERLRAGVARHPQDIFHPEVIRSNFSKSQYLAAVKQIKEYILAGDCYQVNLSQRFVAPLASIGMGGRMEKDAPWALYRRLAVKSPAPYAAYLNLGEVQILSSSPECFLKVDGLMVTTRPIKGTGRRGATPEEDESLRRRLVESPKDRAELLMITDLERNDLGRVCEKGSVTVHSLADVESFAQVHHLVATVEGELAPGKDVVDLLKATFPGGSITGAPKIRAIEIIHELETVPRNVYTGAIGLISVDGKAEFNVAIRTMVIKGGDAYFWAGGGIVADSDPEAEYEETLTKAAGMFESLYPDGLPGRWDDRRIGLKGGREEEGDQDPGHHKEVVDPDRMEPREEHHQP